MDSGPIRNSSPNSISDLFVTYRNFSNSDQIRIDVVP